MTDDIETLRRLADHIGTEERKETLTALERLEGELAIRKERAQQFQRERAELFDKLNGTPCAEIRWQYERDSLRAKLERAKEAIAALLACPEIADCDPRDKDTETENAERRARAILSELSADAPAQLCPVHGKPFPCCVDFDATKPAQHTQRDLRVLTDTELAEHLSDIEKRWGDLAASLEESGGCAGSPCEWLAEEMDAVRAEQKRRAQQTQISYETVEQSP